MLAVESSATVKWETPKWADFWIEAAPLFRNHWAEIALNHDKFPLDWNVAGYAEMERLGRLFILTARKEDELIGYLIAFVSPHLHYWSSGPMAATDIYYVRPEDRRGLGIELFIEFERQMRERGVVQIVTSCKVHFDQSKLFKFLGWTHSDNTFLKCL